MAVLDEMTKLAREVQRAQAKASRIRMRERRVASWMQPLAFITIAVVAIAGIFHRDSVEWLRWTAGIGAVQSLMVLYLLWLNARRQLHNRFERTADARYAQLRSEA